VPGFERIDVSAVEQLVEVVQIPALKPLGNAAVLLPRPRGGCNPRCRRSREGRPIGVVCRADDETRPSQLSDTSSLSLRGLDPRGPV
jgi:hypothetical protein